MERQFDVIVVGGGTAGFAAAVTAARGGAKTLLIEEKAYLGGTATGAQVSMFMGLPMVSRTGLSRASSRT